MIQLEILSVKPLIDLLNNMNALLAKYKAIKNKKTGNKVPPQAPEPAPVEAMPEDTLVERQKHALYPLIQSIIANNSNGITLFSPSKVKAEAEAKVGDDADAEVKEGDVEDSEEKGTHLAILVLIIDDLPHEAIWRLWLEQANEASSKRVRFLFHAKFPDRVTSAWIRKHLVDFTFRPQWGSVEITKAMIGLVRQAITEDPTRQIGKFAFASESCLPCRPLEEALESIFQDDSSWMRAKCEANNGYAQQAQWGVLEDKLPLGIICKADQWVLLNREHAQSIISLPDMLHEERIKAEAEQEAEFERERQQAISAGLPIPEMNVFSIMQQERYGRAIDTKDSAREEKEYFGVYSKVGASDEMYIPCTLAILGHLQLAPIEEPTSVEGKNVSLRALTYVDWSESTKNPRTFLSLEEAEKDGSWKTGLKEGSIFFRKVKVQPQSQINSRSLDHPHLYITRCWLRLTYGIKAEKAEGLLNRAEEIYSEPREYVEREDQHSQQYGGSRRAGGGRSGGSRPQKRYREEGY
jgi:hypothetical protein